MTTPRTERNSTRAPDVITAGDRPVVDTDRDMVEALKSRPHDSFPAFLEQYTPVLLRMIRRFMSDVDEVMEVYADVCHRLTSRDYRALRRIRSDTEFEPWLSIIVANACRDRFRRKRVTSMPRAVVDRLD